MKTKIYKDKQEVAERFASYFANLVNDYGIFHVALSGGSTPKLIFDVLAEQYGDTIDWSQIHFYIF
jgi:6-phosphogluconolactonase